MKGRSIHQLGDLSWDEIEHLLDLSARFAADGIPRVKEGRSVCGLFFNPSLRTRTSLDLASAALGAHAITHDVGRGVWKLETRDGVVMDGDAVEHVKDAITHFLTGAVDALGVRAFANPTLTWEENRTDPIFRAIEEAATIPVVNLESALYHPMQGLADLLTVRNHLDGPPADHVVTITWAYHPKPLPMAVVDTALLAFCRAGYQVRLAHPEGFDLDPEIMTRARDAGGDRLTVVHDMDEAFRGAHVAYAKSWGSLSEYAGGFAHRDQLRDWIVDGRRQALGAPAAFMHCLPVRRNVVVTDEVIDGPHSWVAEEAHNRILTQAAILHEILP